MSAGLAGKIRRWVGVAMLEAAGRLVILTGTTAVLARLLVPADFGAAALVLIVVAIFGVCVGTPYEEALAQRRVVRTADLQAALAVSVLAAILCLLAAWPIGTVMARAFERPDLARLLAGATLMVFGQASLSISTAVARRRRAFNTINIASIVGHLIGAATAIAMAWAGAGVWSLIGLRVAILVANALALQALLRLWLWPRWSWPRIAALNRFAGFILLARLVENGTYLVYNFVVAQIFGLTILGYVNMALRIVEPMRGAIAAITHNLCFSFFVSANHDPARTAGGVVSISSQSALLTAPMFMGIAGISPLLIPIMAGPGWDSAVPIAAMLAIGGMILLPSQIALTALSAMGRPKQGLLASTIGLLTIVVVLLATAGMDPAWVGAARLLGDVVQAVAVVLLSAKVIPLPVRALVTQLAMSWLSAGLMAIGVVMIGHAAAPFVSMTIGLVVGMIGGVTLYGGMLLVLARPSLLALLRIFGLKSGPVLTGGEAV